MEIELKKTQIKNLVKLVTSEERNKTIIIPETWERAPAGKPKDPIGYWKALYDNLKKGGIPVQYQYANDPAKSGYMWWGSWVIYKDLNKNGGYPISFTTPKKNQYLFKFKDGIYRGTSDLSKLFLISECITYSYPMNNSIFKKNQKDITTILYNDLKAKPRVTTTCTMKMVNFALDNASINAEKDKKAVTDAFNSSLGPFLEKNKPASVTYFKGRTQQTLTYNTGQGLQFRSDGTIHYPKNGVKDGAITKYGTWSWDAKSGKPIVKNLKNQTLDIGQVINYPYKQLIAGDVEDEKLAQQIFTDLKKAFDYDNDGDWTDYDRTNETLAMNTINKIKNKGVLDKLNAKIAAGGFPEIKNVEQWFKLEMSNWDPTEWDVIAKRLNSLGYSIPPAGTIAKIYGYAADKTINMIDKGITAVEDKFNYANKQTAVRKYTEPQALQILETQVSPPVDFLADIILNATRWYGDSENLVARVFSRINNKQRYDQMAVIMKQDPFKFVQTFLSSKQIEKPISANVPSIRASYENITAPKMTGLDTNSKDFMKNLNSKLTFRVDNPSGTGPKFINKNTNTVVFELTQGKNFTDPYIKGEKATIIKNFGWDLNPKLYPTPLAYPMDWINTAKKSIGKLNIESKYVKLSPKQQIIEDIVKKYKHKLKLNQINEIGMDGKIQADRDVDAYNRQEKQKEEAQKQKEEADFKPIKIMQDWNGELARQKQLIPQYCTTPLEVKETLEYERSSGGGSSGGSSMGGAGGASSDILTSQVISTKKLSMSFICKDYGGLWVSGGLTNKYTCTCRDLKAPVFGKIQIDTGTNGKKTPAGATKIFGTFLNIGEDIQDQQTSRDWTDPTTWVEITKQAVEYATIVASLIFPVAAPLIGVIGGLAAFGLSAAQGDTTGAAIALLFTILPGLKVLNIEQALFRSLGTKLIKGGVLTAKEVRAFYTIMNSEKAIATGLMGGMGNAKKISMLANTKVTSATSATLKQQVMAARASVQGADFLAKMGSEKLDPVKAQDAAKNITSSVTTQIDKETQEVRS